MLSFAVLHETKQKTLTNSRVHTMDWKSSLSSTSQCYISNIMFNSKQYLLIAG